MNAVSGASYHAIATKLAFETKVFIDGRFAPALSGKTFETENPATGKIITRVAECDAADVDLAVKAARKARESGSWSRMAPRERKRTLLRFSSKSRSRIAASRFARGRSRECCWIIQMRPHYA